MEVVVVRVLQVKDMTEDKHNMVGVVAVAVQVLMEAMEVFLAEKIMVMVEKEQG